MDFNEPNNRYTMLAGTEEEEPEPEEQKTYVP